jgi:hypothetical protein
MFEIVIGTVSGRATDAGLFRWVYCLGSIFQLLGIFATAEATKFWQLFLAQVHSQPLFSSAARIY